MEKNIEMIENAEAWKSYRKHIKPGADERLAPRFEAAIGDEIHAMLVRHPSAFLQALSNAVFSMEVAEEPPAELECI